MSWIADGGAVATVQFGGDPTPGTLLVNIKLGSCFNVMQTFQVTATNMHPLGALTYPAVLCSDSTLGSDKTDVFATMLQSDISFALNGPSELSLSGSGLVLQLQAQ